MKCANCGHSQIAEIKCEQCGAYFKKMSSNEDAPQADRRSAGTRSKKSTLLVPLMIAAMLIGGFTYYNSQQKEPTTEAPVADVSIEADSPTEQVQIGGMAQEIARTHAGRNNIETARNATVFIETPWGTLGSGFLINAECQVISNRHVMDFDPEKEIETYLASTQFQAEVFIRRSKLMPNYMQLRTEVEQMGLQGTGRANVMKVEKKLKALADEIDGIANKLEQDMRNSLRKVERDGRRAGFTVSFINGDEYKINTNAVDFAEEYDLAIFSIRASNCPYIELGVSSELEIGSQLYTVGNPSGLRHTVTSGIFSGRHITDEITMLQTDAPINPGNSGGPLITPDGKVIGVNTSILRDAEGIGFAIPVEAVKEQLKDYIR